MCGDGLGEVRDSNHAYKFVKLAKDKGCKAQIIIGGACINESFKDEISADGYSADAAECVKLVSNLMSRF